jgi:sensitive to high expression protein 9, mitochondrial
LKAQEARETVTKAKEEYNSAVTTRAETQRELTNLLNRKTSWTPADLARFTQLYPSDHENEQRVVRAAEELSRAERVSEEASADLGRLILSRFVQPPHCSHCVPLGYSRFLSSVAVCFGKGG